jgi:hypothetical protein
VRVELLRVLARRHQAAHRLERLQLLDERQRFGACVRVGGQMAPQGQGLARLARRQRRQIGRHARRSLHHAGVGGRQPIDERTQGSAGVVEALHASVEHLAGLLAAHPRGAAGVVAHRGPVRGVVVEGGAHGRQRIGGELDLRRAESPRQLGGPGLVPHPGQAIGGGRTALDRWLARPVRQRAEHGPRGQQPDQREHATPTTTRIVGEGAQQRAHRGPTRVGVGRKPATDRPQHPRGHP